MKVFIIGMGECGGRIADKFLEEDERIGKELGEELKIVTECMAIDSDARSLDDLKKVPVENRIMIGAGKGGKTPEKAKKFFDEHTVSNIVEKINSREGAIKDTDAFLVISSTAGNTGSATSAILIDNLKKQFGGRGIPIYWLGILPDTDNPNPHLKNTRECIKEICTGLVKINGKEEQKERSDGVFLFDNKHWKGFSFRIGYDQINEEIVRRFRPLFTVGEMVTEEEESGGVSAVASSTLDPAKIMTALEIEDGGVAIIGHASDKVDAGKIREKEKNLIEVKIKENEKYLEYTEEAIEKKKKEIEEARDKEISDLEEEKKREIERLKKERDREVEEIKKKGIIYRLTHDIEGEKRRIEENYNESKIPDVEKEYDRRIEEVKGKYDTLIRDKIGEMNKKREWIKNQTDIRKAPDETIDRENISRIEYLTNFAIGDRLSVPVSKLDAKRALIVITGPKEALSRVGEERAQNILRSRIEEATGEKEEAWIFSGSYPQPTDEITVTALIAGIEEGIAREAIRKPVEDAISTIKNKMRN